MKNTRKARSERGTYPAGEVAEEMPMTAHAMPEDLWAAWRDARSTVRRNYALITPASHVPAPHPAWPGARTVTLISPHLGARFVQYLALLEAGTEGLPPNSGVERFLYVLAGTVEFVATVDRASRPLDAGAYAYLPPGATPRLRALQASRLLVFERRYHPAVGVAAPEPIVAHVQTVPAMPFLGNPRALLQTLLPDLPAYDLAVNVFTFQPGACLPLVEVHVMEHGLLLLEGGGIYRLGSEWYPVVAGDAIWIGSYCPQWFAAVGPVPARYIYYKDINRDALDPGDPVPGAARPAHG